MPTEDFDIDTLDVSMPAFITADGFGGTEGDVKLPYFEPGYEGTIDYRIRQLSYSSILGLHTCPRRFQLYKLRTTAKLDESPNQTITFAYGHCVGLGVQLALEGASWETIVWNLFLQWHAPLFAEGENNKGKYNGKSFFESLFATEKFIRLRESGLLKDYELVYYNGKPATELSFCINFPDGFRYRGYVDAVLRHRISGKIMVLECKTTALTALNPAMFKNSAQGIGYSIVLDVLFPELSSYEVLYFVYQSGAREFTPMPFTKTYLQRALWIRELLLDIETIKSYADAGVYPMHGESCYSFFRECDYINTCTLSTQFLTKPMTENDVDDEIYQVNVSLLDLLESQLEKT